MIRASACIVAFLLPTGVWAQTTLQTAAPPNTPAITAVIASPSPQQPIAPPIATGPLHSCGYKNYPLAAIRLNIEGETTLSYRIATDGSLKDITVLQSSGNKDLDDASVSCATEWRYKPATQNGQPVEIPWRAKVNWSLNRNVSRSSIKVPVPTGPRHVCDKPPGNSLTAILHRGSTILFFNVETDGTVKNVTINQSSGDAELDRYGASCIATWLFTPAIQNGAAVEVMMSSKLNW